MSLAQISQDELLGRTVVRILRAYEGDGVSARDTTEVITLTPAVTDVRCGLMYYVSCLSLVSAEFKTSLTFPQE